MFMKDFFNETVIFEDSVYSIKYEVAEREPLIKVFASIELD